MRYTHKNKGTCSSEVSFDIENGIISNVSFVGGCNGNLKAISKLCEGMTAQDIADKLLGNKCGFKNTSCADQLAKAVRKAYDESKKSA